jgi:hypothetical protein
VRIKSGSIWVPQTPLMDGWTREAVRERAAYVTTDTVATWDGSSLVVPPGGLRTYLLNNVNGRYISHAIPFGTYALADGDALIAYPDATRTTDQTLTAGTYSTLAPGQYVQFATASLNPIQAANAGLIIVAYRKGGSLVVPLNGGIYTNATSVVIGRAPGQDVNTNSDIVCTNIKPTSQVLFSGGAFLDNNRADLFYRAAQTHKVFGGNGNVSASTALGFPQLKKTIPFTVPTGFLGDVIATFIGYWSDSTATALGDRIAIAVEVDATSGTVVFDAWAETSPEGSGGPQQAIAAQVIATNLAAGSHNVNFYIGSVDGTTVSIVGDLIFSLGLTIP